MNNFRSALFLSVALFVSTPVFAFVPYPQSVPVESNIKNTDSLPDIIDKVKDAVVKVRIKIKDGGGGAVGSGFFVNSRGFLLTNYHVVKEADPTVGDSINVELSDRRKFTAKVLGFDETVDIALLKVDNDGPFPIVELEHSKNARVGETVFAIGDPFDFGTSVTKGIISAKDRYAGGPLDDYLQTDAAINKGNSGGPLFNEHGKVIGMNSSIMSPTGASDGIGLAIPTDIFVPLMLEIDQYGHTFHPYFGIHLAELTDVVAAVAGMDSTNGVLVESLDAGPAKKAGMQVGDIVTKFNDIPIYDPHDLSFNVGTGDIGTDSKVTVIRKGQTVVLTIPLIPKGMVVISPEESKKIVPKEKEKTPNPEVKKPHDEKKVP